MKDFSDEYAGSMSIRQVLLHNLSIPFAQAQPALFDFDQNALFFAFAGDVVVTRNVISGEYLSFLAQCGLDFSQVTFIASQATSLVGPYDIFSDQQILARVRSTVGDGRHYVFDSFLLSSYEVVWAQELGLRYEGNPDHYHRFGSKSTFRSLAKEHHFPIARGFENQKEVLDGALRVASLFLRGFSEIVVKHDEGVAAVGSRRFARENFLSQFSSFEKLLANESSHSIVATRSDRFVIEGWYDTVVSSPSVQLYIDFDGQVELISLHVQLFYENKMRYKGCLSEQWLAQPVRAQLIERGLSFARVFSDQGYRGHLAFNTILLQDGTLLWTELNPRRVMSSYPFQLRKRLFGEAAKDVFYISKHVQKELWKGKTIDFVLKALALVLFSCQKKGGVVPFDYGLLQSSGRLSVVAFGSSQEEITTLFHYVESL